MILNLLKVWAFLKRDFLSQVSYRLAFLMQIAGIFFSLLAFFYMTKMFNPNTVGLDGMPMACPAMLIGPPSQGSTRP